MGGYFTYTKQFGSTAGGRNLCTSFCECAIWTWNCLKYGNQVGIQIGEESLTYLNLLNIQICHPDQVRTKKFSRNVEGAVTGADWEWWFGSRSGWLGLRIQAKKLNSVSGQYDYLDHPAKKGATQVDLLIRDAQQQHLVPMYCFYNYHSARLGWSCGSFPPIVELQGCTVASAKYIKTLIAAGDKSLKSVSKRALPWSCLVCCFGYSASNADLTQRVSGVLRGFWELDLEQVTILSQPPGYVSGLLVGPIEESPFIEGPPGLSHLLIVTENLL